MRTVTEFPRKVRVVEDMGVPLPDGRRLSARAWLPEDAEDRPVPAILEYIPYRKRDGTIARDHLVHPYFAGHGYACLRVDVAGNGDSEGLMEDEYAEQELEDGAAVIDWLSRQPWCDGGVGIMGKSWGGFNGLQIAALRPPALKAVVTVCSSVDRFADDIHYKGGCLLGDNLRWGATMLAYSARPPDPEIVGDRWRELWLERLRAQPFLSAIWLRHQRRDGYWRRGSVCEDWDAIRAPVLAFGGWHDNYMNTVGHLVECLRVPAKGIVGPWGHQYAHMAAPAPQIGFLQEALRWWDRWLKGAETGVEDDPALRVWMMDGVRPARSYRARPGRWIAEAEWPSRRVSRETLRLAPGGRLARGAGDGAAGATSPLAAIRTPADCGLSTGEYFPVGTARDGDADFLARGETGPADGPPELHGDQRRDDALSACFDAALDAPLHLLGRARVRLRLVSDRPLGQLAARLCEVAEDGASTRIAHGFLNLAHRESHAEPAPLPVGEPVEIAFDLDLCAWRLAEGSRLRLALSNACWPFLWPAPEAATLEVLEGTLELPVHPGAAADEWTFEAPEAPPPWPHRVLRRPRYDRIAEEDMGTGLVTLRIESDTGEMEDAAHGLATGIERAETWRIRPDDPLSASAEISSVGTMRRGDWEVRTETGCAMRADEESFHLTAYIRTWEGDERVFETAIEETIPRDFL